MARENRILRMMDFGRARANASVAEQTHPLVSASMALTDNQKSRVRTGNLVGLLLAHAARSRRRSMPRSNVRLQVVGPAGGNAVRIRLS